jgi:protein-S-isoprenylcysteine O-methyltransferase Ste14
MVVAVWAYLNKPHGVSHARSVPSCQESLYLAIAAILAGVSALYGAWSVRHLVHATIVALGAHLVVVRMEEPATRKRLGAEYEEYCRTVPRWIPRFRRVR